MADSKVYRVTLPNSFEAPGRNRAGLRIDAGPNGSIHRLTNDQVKALKEDPMISLKELKGSDLKAAEGQVSPAPEGSDETANPITDRGAPLPGVEGTDDYSDKRMAALRKQTGGHPEEASSPADESAAREGSATVPAGRTRGPSK